jgi:hypothetical protein
MIAGLKTVYAPPAAAAMREKPHHWAASPK